MDARDRLAEAMNRRRAELRTTWERVAERGHTSVATLRRVRHQRDELTFDTQVAVEDGLDWPRGTVAAILEGRDPPSTGDVEVAPDRFVQIVPPNPDAPLGRGIRVPPGVERLSEDDIREFEEFLRYKVVRRSQYPDKRRTDE